MSEYDYVKWHKQYSRRKAEFIDALPGDAIKLEEYNGFELDRYYYSESLDKLIMFTRGRYKVVNPTKYNDSYSVVFVDINDQHHTCSYKKFYKQIQELIANENIE